MGSKQSIRIGDPTGRVPFFRGMRGTLLGWFVLLAMVPMALVSIISYNHAQKALTESATEKLIATRQIRKDIVLTLFDKWHKEILFVSQMEDLKSDIVDMAAAFKFLGPDRLKSFYAAKPDLSNAGEGSAYSAVHQEEHNFFKNYTKIQQHEDVLLIDPAGNVIYTEQKGPAFGVSLTSERYQGSNLAGLYQDLKAAKPGDVLVVDAALFENDVAMFMGTPIFRGDVCPGYLVFQLPLKYLSQRLGRREGMGRTGEVYLVGPDRRIRSDSFNDPVNRTVKASLSGTVEQNGVDTLGVGEALAGKEGVGVTTDYRGKQVLSAYGPASVNGLNWVVISEMDVEEALAPALALRNITAVLICGTGLLALLLSFFVSGRIVRPIRELTTWAIQVAGGDLTRKEIKTPKNEIGDLGTAFKEMAENLQHHTGSLKRLSSELQIIIDSIPGLVFYKDRENRFLRVNKYMADAHRMKKEELEGKDLFELYPREQAQAYLEDDLELINSGKARLNIDEPWDIEAGRRWVSTSKIPFVDESGKIIGIIGVSMDVTERKQAEEALTRKSRIMDAINRVFRGALTCKTEEEVAKIALSVAEELTGSKFGFILEINAAGLVDTIAITDPGWDACKIVVSEAKNFIKNMPVRGIDRSVLKDGKSRIVTPNEMTTHPDRVGMPQGHPPISCFLGVPFKQEGKATGMVGLANKEGGYNREDQEAVEALSVAFYEALVKKRMEIAVERRNWIRTGQTRLNDAMRGEKSIQTLAGNIIRSLSKHIGAQVGALFLAEDDRLKLGGRYAYRKHETVPETFGWGEGLVGQAAADKKQMLLSDVPEDYVVVGSALGQSVPTNIVVVPCLFEGEVKCVIELGSLRAFSDLETEFLDSVAEGIAIAIQTAQAREKLKSLLEETQRQSEELQTQQEELKAANEELEDQTQRLTESEERLKAQQEELEVTNEELEEKNDLLERQKREVEQARRQIEEKAAEVALASKYKSEFLANMSHELRTPLNSLLLLAQGLAQNKEGNLTAEQVESARIVYGSGSDLLNLINEILDLSKIEAGRMELQLTPVQVSNLAERVRGSFGHMCDGKGLSLEVTVRDDAPVEITSDSKRVEQVIRNLVSNAVKFTERGSVIVTFGQLSLVDGHWQDDTGKTVELRTPNDQSPMTNDRWLSIAVRDTGIGIAPEKQKTVFEAFQQADGGTARKYGGTGLGLSISRELTRLLGGEIQLESEVGKGSAFNLYLPIDVEQTRKSELGARRKEEDVPRSGSPSCEAAVQSQIANRQLQILDDRESIKEGDRAILVVEDDANFARILLNKCHEKGFKCVAAATGEMGVELASKHLPSAVILDIRLPGMDGWAVLQALKEDIHTRHIPVHVVSVEQASTESLRRGAVGHAVKPVSQEELEETFRRLEQVSAGKPRRVLVVEDDPKIRHETVGLIGDGDVTVDEAGTGAEALKALGANRYHCMVMDLGLPDMDGNELLATIEQEGLEMPPVIVHTARDLTYDQEMALREHAESIVIKDVRSQERLLDEVSLFLHRMVSQMPDNKRKIIQDLYDTDELLRDKKVLVVDDDMRTSFAVSRLLSERGMTPMKAENGERALRLLDEQPGVALVLMDIMMPVMDGYEAMKQIRAQERFQKLPIIALTAKAMPEDREKCLAAGANDYLPKPVDAGRLISMMRVWLYR